ncbi:MAG: SLBB domain-containing protein [Alphaproteobacteria bacterium]|nr:SLBB domain-containing protein [Alphaproteobacteria bacterium SS10]
MIGRRAGRGLLRVASCGAVLSLAALLGHANLAGAQSFERDVPSIQTEPLGALENPVGQPSDAFTRTDRDQQFDRRLQANEQRLSTREEEPPHPLAELFSERAGTELRLFGAALRQSLAPKDESTTTRADRQPPPVLGRISDDYRLGVGDRLVIRLRGQQNATETVTIDPTGEVAVDQLPPIAAAGLTLGTFRALLAQSLEDRFLDTQAFVTVSGIRQIAVTVTGSVAKPGLIQLSAQSTALDAIAKAGGIDALGSLRGIRLFPADGGRVSVDLYDLLLGGAATGASQLLSDGDRLHVPPIGATLALTGDIKRPGIFELAPGQTSIDLTEAIIMSGGPLSPGAHDVVVSRLGADGLEQHMPVSRTGQIRFGDGDLVIWTTPKAVAQGRVRISGYAGRQGTVALDKAVSLSRLLAEPGVMRPDTYGWFALIGRHGAPSGGIRYIAFAPQAIIDGQSDRRLQDRDQIILFEADRFPMPAVDTVSVDEAQSEDEVLDRAGLTTDGLRELTTPLLVDLGGAVQRPGRYPVAAEIGGSDLLALAGGPRPGADIDRIALRLNERGSQPIDPITNLAALDSVQVSAGGSLRLQAGEPTTLRQVSITGAVRHPGDYTVTPGDRLSDLIARAGGLTNQAFAAGAVFTRAAARREERQPNQRAARELDQAVARLLIREEEPDRDLVSMSQRLAEELRSAGALGRITVTADPDTLATRPDLDPLLRDGDAIFYPERDLTVRVAGEVLSPAALQFTSEKTPTDYLREAGGFTRLADKSRAFIVYPDGSARPLSISAWQYDPANVVPGSTIVAPRDPKPFDAVELTANIGNILSQIAVTAASIAVIADDDD